MEEAELNYLLKRGVAEIIVEDEMAQLLRAGKKLRLKEGFDPSFPDIHLGHMVALRKLRQFQERGHQIVLIVADWTAQIGDPSGMSATRPMLTIEEVKANAETYMQQFFTIVDKKKTEIRWQSEWFGKFDLSDIIKLTSKFTVAQFLARDDFSARYKAEKPIALTELLYPLLQAYDSVAIEADVEFGGTDQKFNFLVGRELQSMMGQRPQQCFMVPLLLGTDGSHKMSKSLGNYIGVTESPEQIYGKVMSVPDDLVLTYFELITDVPDKELGEFKAGLEKQELNPMLLKKRLAREIITQLYDNKSATEAEAHFEKTVQQKEMPEDIPHIKLTEELLSKIRARSRKEKRFETSIGEVSQPETREYVISVPLLLHEAGLVKSRGEASRLINQGAVRIDGKTVNEVNCLIKSGCIIKVGKRRFAKIIDKD